MIKKETFLWVLCMEEVAESPQKKSKIDTAEENEDDAVIVKEEQIEEEKEQPGNEGANNDEDVASARKKTKVVDVDAEVVNESVVVKEEKKDADEAVAEQSNDKDPAAKVDESEIPSGEGQKREETEKQIPKTRFSSTPDLPFLFIVPDTGKLAKAKRVLSLDKYAFVWWDVVLEWAEKDSLVAVAQKRQFFKSILEIFPTSGRIWNMLVNMEISRGKV